MMSNNKKIGLAVGAAVAVGAAAVGGYVVMKDRGTDTSTAASAPSASTSGAVEEDIEPVASLAAVIPDGVDLYLEVPSVRELAKASTEVKWSKTGLFDLLGMLDKVGSSVGAAFGLSPKDGSALVSSLKALSFAGRFKGEAPFAGGVIACSKPSVVKTLLASPRFEKSGKLGELDKYVLKASTNAPSAEVELATSIAMGLRTPPGASLVWLADKGLMVVGTDAFLESVVAVTAGKEKALGASEQYRADIARLAPKARVFAYAPADVMKSMVGAEGGQEVLDGFFKQPGPFLLGVHAGPAGLLVSLEGGVQGDKVPALSLPAPPLLDLPKALPADTLGYLAFSTKLDMTGSEAEKKLVEVVRAFDADGANELEARMGTARAELGFGMAEVLDALGEQAVIGVVTSEKELSLEDAENADLEKNIAVVTVLSLRDEAKAKKVITAARKLTPLQKTHTQKATADGGFDATPTGAGPFIATRFDKGRWIVGVGPQALVEGALASIVAGSPSLGDDAAHKLGLSGIAGTPYVLSWVDVSRVLAKTPTDPEMAGALGALRSHVKITGDDRVTLTTALGLAQEGEAYRVRLDMLNSFGVLPAVGILGVRRYLSASKGAEAKNTLGAIARAAVAGFEREAPGGGHRLCKSAQPVPAAVPSGAKYQPSTVDGSDFETGDEETGWRCLRFTMMQPHYFQYGYTMGGPYKGPARGGPDPGPNGFEAWAIGDLDGDGVTSLFTRTGSVDASGRLVLATELFVVDEHE